MVGTKKRWMTALLVLVLAVCLSALCWFVLPTKNINAADGSGAETTTEQPAAGESQSAEALQQAINAAEDGAKVQMTSNITGNISIAEGKNIVLDLNSYTLTGEGDHTIVNNGTLTVIDSSAAKSGAVDNITHGRGALVNNGTATLNGGTFKRSAEAGVSATNNGGNSWYVIDNHGTLTINDGVAVYHGASAEMAAQWKYSSLIRNIGTSAEATATLTVNGGEFNTGLIALKNDDFGMLEVNGGKISSGNQAVQNWYKATVDGGTFDGRVITWFYSDNTGAADMTINNGTFSGQVKSVDFEAGADGVYPLVSDGTTISGGTFDALPLKAEYLASDVALDVVDDAYSVVRGQAAANAVIDGVTYPFVDENDIIEQGTFAAQIGNTFFETLAEAVLSTGTGAVDATEITIIGEGNVVNGAGVVIEGQNVIIDLNGKTYNVINPTVGSPGTETNAFQMKKGSTVVFRNGSIASDVAKILLQNYCDLTLENVTINATGSTSIQYIASNNNGSFTAVGNTQLIAGAGQVAFDVYYNLGGSYPDGVTVTFGEDFTGKVVGAVEYGYDVATDNWQDKTVLNISGGKFDITISPSGTTAQDANINISGGDFTQAFDGAYLASDAVLYPTADGAFAVADQATAEQETIGVAQIGQVIYETLADALAAAQDGDEIDLLTNISAPGAINITNDITLDFNGHAIDSDRTIAIVIDGANANIISTGARGTLNTPANGISVINGSNVEISDIDIYTEIYILKKDDGSQQVYDGRAIQIVGSTAVIDNVVTSLTADNADYTVAHWYIGDSDVTITNSNVMLVYTRSAASAENGSLQGYAVYSDNSDVTIENSSISSTGDETAYGVIFFGNMAIADAAAANGEGFKTLSLTGTAVIADAFAVSGNGTPNDCSGTDIVITGDCKIKSNYAQAIYHPQYGVLTINLTEDSALAYIRGVSGI